MDPGRENITRDLALALLAIGGRLRIMTGNSATALALIERIHLELKSMLLKFQRSPILRMLPFSLQVRLVYFVLNDHYSDPVTKTSSFSLTAAPSDREITLWDESTSKDLNFISKREFLEGKRVFAEAILDKTFQAEVRKLRDRCLEHTRGMKLASGEECEYLQKTTGFQSI